VKQYTDGLLKLICWAFVGGLGLGWGTRSGIGIFGFVLWACWQFRSR